MFSFVKRYKASITARQELFERVTGLHAGITSLHSEQNIEQSTSEQNVDHATQSLDMCGRLGDAIASHAKLTHAWVWLDMLFFRKVIRQTAELTHIASVTKVRVRNTYVFLDAARKKLNLEIAENQKLLNAIEGGNDTHAR